MNNTDLEYFRLLNLVLDKGKVKQNRTNMPTRGVFGAQARFDLQEGFPLLTTKKVFFKGIVHELLWFLSGSTNIKYLVDNDVHIWDEWAYKRYEETTLSSLPMGHGFVEGRAGEYINIEHLDCKSFIEKIKTNQVFAKKWGELGEGTYGSMWRAFPANEYSNENCVDQIEKVVDSLINNSDSRRHIVTAWHPAYVDSCALPPCHCLFQFHTEELTLAERHEEAHANYQKYSFPHVDDPYESLRWDSHEEMDSFNVPKRRLNCQLYQRSCDLFLGIPFNIASYALLTHMVAQVTNMVAGEFIHTYGDLHLYENHLNQVQEQLNRIPRKLPTLCLNSNVDNIFDFKYEDIQIHGYDPHPAIKGEVAV